MDPDACVDRINAAIAAYDYTEAAEACGDLARWLRAGGFPPSRGLSIDAQIWVLFRVFFLKGGA